MIILGAVGITSATIFQDDGLIKDTKDTQANTHQMITDTHVYIDKLNK